MTEGHNCIRYSGVEISDCEICRLKKEKPVLKINREHIKIIRLCHDTPARNPFFQFFTGFILVFLGFVGLIVLFLANWAGISLFETEPDNLRVPIIPVVLWVMTGSGFWLLAGVFRARYFLVIHTERGVERIFFEKATCREGLDQFLRKAHIDLGYEIDTSPLGQDGSSSHGQN